MEYSGRFALPDVSVRGSRCGRSSGVDRLEKALVGVLNVSVNDDNPAAIGAETDDVLQTGSHLGERLRSSSATEQDGRVLVFRTAVVSRASYEPLRGLIDSGSQHDLDEWNPGVRRQLIQDLNKVDPADELADEHVVTGMEVGLGHSTSEVPGSKPRRRWVFEGTAEHRTDDVDIESQS